MSELETALRAYGERLAARVEEGATAATEPRGSRGRRRVVLAAACIAILGAVGGLVILRDEPVERKPSAREETPAEPPVGFAELEGTWRLESWSWPSKGEPLQTIDASAAPALAEVTFEKDMVRWGTKCGGDQINAAYKPGAVVLNPARVGRKLVGCIATDWPIHIAMAGPELLVSMREGVLILEASHDDWRFSAVRTTLDAETPDARCPALSAGPHPMVEVPDVEGMSYEDAAATLLDVPLCPVLAAGHQPAGSIESQSPAAGSYVPSEGGITLRTAVSE